MILNPDLSINLYGKFEIHQKAYYRASQTHSLVSEVASLIAMYTRDKKKKNGLGAMPLQYDDEDEYIQLVWLQTKLLNKMTAIDLTCKDPETVFQICIDTDLLCERAERLINKININNYMPPKIKNDTLAFILS